MRQRRDSAAIPDALHRLREMRFAPVHIRFRGFVEIEVERLPQVADVSLLHQNLREVRTAGHPASPRLRFL